MAMPLRCPRHGRLLDFAIVTPLLAVFLGLAFYHFRRIDRFDSDPEQAKELASQKFRALPPTDNDWPQWRGPRRDGISTETNILREWPEGGPKRLWQAKVGEGFSSVVVARGRA